MVKAVDWVEAIKPLLKKYRKQKHPLDYQSPYQLMVMVVLSAQSSDVAVNELAPALFKAFPDMRSLSTATPEMLFPYIRKMRNFGHKANWLVAIAQKIKLDSHIPRTLDELTELPGIGRKSANVILRETGAPAEGVIVDLHVLRVAARLGIAEGEDPKKMEKQIMEELPPAEWDAGMAMSFLGREICRPQPECERCLMNPVCAWYKKNIGKIKAGAEVDAPKKEKGGKVKAGVVKTSNIQGAKSGMGKRKEEREKKLSGAKTGSGKSKGDKVVEPVAGKTKVGRPNEIKVKSKKPASGSRKSR